MPSLSLSLFTEQSANPVWVTMENEPPFPSTAKGKDPDNDPPSFAPELVALFRLLMREPPPGHDSKRCPLCRAYGIKRI